MREKDREFTLDEVVEYALKCAMGYDWKNNIGDPENQAIGNLPGFFEDILILTQWAETFVEKYAVRGQSAGDLLTLMQAVWLRGYRVAVQGTP